MNDAEIVITIDQIEIIINVSNLEIEIVEEEKVQGGMYKKEDENKKEIIMRV